MSISNKTGKGVRDLHNRIAQTASELPLMGESWPGTWLDTANSIRKLNRHHITPYEFEKLAKDALVYGTDIDVLANWMHELGDILYFQSNPQLSDTIILKPQWVSQQISRILESDEVIKTLGILRREHMQELWHDIPPALREHFLHLMEQFDLSYLIPDDPQNRSLVVERLSLAEANYTAEWNRLEDSSELRMKYLLHSTMPAGIPSWFIARAHRFSIGIHWRYGALFADQAKKHIGLVRAFPHDRYLELTVRGPNPENFFTLLRDGLDLTLSRFPGLEVTRTIPCPCKGKSRNRCDHEFEYDDLLKRLELKPPKYTIECPKSIENVDVRQMLFGLAPTTTEEVLKEVQRVGRKNLDQHTALLAILQREFVTLFRSQQALLETQCPNSFMIFPAERSSVPTRLLGEKLTLQLLCQAPGEWHYPINNRGEYDGRYTIYRPDQWLKTLVEPIQRLSKFFKFILPVLIPGLGLVAADYADTFKMELETMNRLIERISDTNDPIGAEFAEYAERDSDVAAEGASLRGLRRLLDELDPDQHWGGLKPVLTPEGHPLWLCDYHAQQYGESAIRVRRRLS